MTESPDGGAKEGLMLGPLGTPELLIIGVVIILIFGVGKISGLGRELGSSIKEFRRAVKDEDAEGKNAAKTQVQAPPPPVYSAPAPPVQQPPSQPTETKNPNIF